MEKERKIGHAVVSYTYHNKSFTIPATFIEGFGKNLDAMLLDFVESIIRSGASLNSIERDWIY